MAGIPREEIGVVICATITPDNIVPSQACLLQKSLGLTEQIFAFDICAACTGFLYAMHTARSSPAPCRKRNTPWLWQANC